MPVLGFLCNVLSLLWNALSQGTINPKVKKLPYTNHKVNIRRKHYGKGSIELADHVRFTQIRNSLKRLKRDLRSKFEMRIAKEVKTNPKDFW